MSDAPRIPWSAYQRFPEAHMLQRAQSFAADLARRRTVRDFSPEAVPQALIADCLRAAGSAPSGANQQPWRFVAISDASIKREIRLAAEAEEQAFYAHRAPDSWLQALAPLGTDAQKPFLETAPWLIAVFYQRYALDEAGNKVKRYYPHESVGIACGMLITALHHAGLATLTHTPSPMGFLNQILRRGSNEMAYLLLVTGYPTADCTVPDIQRLLLEDYTVFV
jgi:iodotyrosine deiodinase